MKTLIVGAGVIGTIYGWALEEAGVDVTHFVRSGRGAALADGVLMDVLDERKGRPKNNITPYKLKWSERVTPEDGFELVIVPTNSFQVEAAARTLVPACPQAVFLILATNWEGTAVLDQLLPHELYVLGYPDGGGTIRNGVYWTNLGAEIHLGRGNAGSDAFTGIQNLFAWADIKADVQTNMLHWLWVHNAMSTPFAAGLGKYGAIRRFLQDGVLVKQCFAACKEVLELCHRRGVNLEEYPEIGQFKLPKWLFLIIFRLLMRFNKSMQRFTAHAVIATAETRANYLAIMQTAQELGVTMLNMQALGAYVQPFASPF